MSEETTKPQTEQTTEIRTARPSAERARRPGGPGGRGPRKGGSDRKGAPRKEVREFEQKTIEIRRVTRVVAGGRRFSFSVAMVIGDGKGKVGVGIGKAGDTALAIQKAFNDAKKNLVTLNLTAQNSIPYEVDAKYNSARLMMMPNGGRGIVAGSSVRSVLELAGMRDITTKIFSRTKNKLNIAKAAIKALEPFVMAKGVQKPVEKQEAPKAEVTNN